MRCIPSRFPQDGTLLASGSLDKSIKIWELPSGKEKFRLKDHAEAVCTVVFQESDTSLLSASLDKTLRTWDPATGQLRSTMAGHAAYLTCMAPSPG